MCENKVRPTCRLNLQHAIVTHAWSCTPRECEAWPKEAMFTSLYSLTLDVHVTVRVVLDIRQYFIFFIAEQNP